MRTTRRDLLKLGALATAAAALPSTAASSWSTPAGGVGKAARPLDILILGGTGFTGPFQVNRSRHTDCRARHPDRQFDYLLIDELRRHMDELHPAAGDGLDAVQHRVGARRCVVPQGPQPGSDR